MKGRAFLACPFLRGERMIFKNAVLLREQQGEGLTILSLARKIKEYVEGLDEAKEAVGILDYWSLSRAEINNSTLDADDTREVVGHVNTGGNEGVYLDVFVRTRTDEVQVMTLKTLDEDIRAYALMGMLSGLIYMAGEVYLYANDLY